MFDSDSNLWRHREGLHKQLHIGRPEIGPQGKSIRAIEQGNVRLELDLSGQQLRLDVPKRDKVRFEKFEAGDTVEITVDDAPFLHYQDVDVTGLPKGRQLGVLEAAGAMLRVGILHQGKPLFGWIEYEHAKFVQNNPVLVPRLARREDPYGDDFVSAAVLIQKAKQFDDGLYATIEVLAQQGAGHFAGKQQMLATLSEALVQANRIDAAALTILSATQLGQPDIQYPAIVAERVRDSIRKFRNDELRSKPLGVYTWTQLLTQIFEQDRMLQTAITSKSEAMTLAETLRSKAECYATYLAYLNLIARLTNPLAGDDLGNRDLLSQLDWAGHPPVAFFPPSRNHEAELVERLRPNSTGDDFDLFTTLIAAVRSGEISLKPTAESGWYDRQIWSLEPLIVPDRNPESQRLILERGYHEHLERLFKGAMALVRETHVKQLKVSYGAAMCKPPVTIDIAPLISVEPLPTCYRRRAAAYRFVREHLEATFGADALQQTFRAMLTKHCDTPLLQELIGIEELFLGAAISAELELGMIPEEFSVGSTDSSEGVKHHNVFQDWRAHWDHDPDVSSDARMMVPVSYDDISGRIRVWMFLGWNTDRLNCSFAAEPQVQITRGNAEILFKSTSKTLWSPVVAEMEVTQLLNREEFRNHCDAYISQKAILRNLK